MSLAAAAVDIASLGRERAVFVGGPATASRVDAELQPLLLPRDLLTAAKVLTLQRAVAQADGDQAAPVAAGARAGGSGTASTSSGAR